MRRPGRWYACPLIGWAARVRDSILLLRDPVFEPQNRPPKKASNFLAFSNCGRIGNVHTFPKCQNAQDCATDARISQKAPSTESASKRSLGMQLTQGHTISSVCRHGACIAPGATTDRRLGRPQRHRLAATVLAVLKALCAPPACAASSGAPSALSCRLRGRIEQKSSPFCTNVS
jgi:hypothetical protein